MAKKLKGFSLAEVLITLLVVGIVGAAAIPTMTKRSTGTDKMWDWADYPVGSAYSVGTHVLLNASETDANVIQDGLTPAEYLPNIDSTLASAVMPTGSPPVSPPAYDKLILMNNFNIEGLDEDSRFAKPHISFYNKSRSLLGGTVTDYAGSLTADRTNLALGIGSLQTLVPTATEGLFNTAVGHYALLNNKYGINNTALGNMSLASMGYNLNNVADDHGNHNVAIGAESQRNNVSFDYNTSVGFDSLSGSLAGNQNIALGASALGSTDPQNNFFEENNIAIGTNAGLNRGVADARNDRLFIGREEEDFSKPFVEADMASNSTFDINADELIVNTADGTHTILKIRMIDDSSVSLPVIKEDSNKNWYYESLGYCVGEGTDDLAKLAANKLDASALAEVCIAKFSNNTIVKIRDLEVEITGGDTTFLNRLRSFFKQIINNTEYVVKEPEIDDKYDDWDVYLKGLNVGIYGFTSTTLTSKRAYIQTVKASLNYLDTWKEGMGILSTMMQAFTNNFICFFDFFDAADACKTYSEDDPVTFQDYLTGRIKKFLDSIKDLFGGLREALANAKADRIAHYQQKLSECESKTIGKKACRNHYQNLLNLENISDVRLKNVEGKSTAGLKEINALKIKNYTYKADKAQTPHVGVIAQELQQVFPNSVFEGPNGYLKIKQEEIFYAMVNAIKELDEQSIELKGEIPKVNKQIKTTVDKNKKLLTKNEKLKLENEKLMAQLKELEK